MYRCQYFFDWREAELLEKTWGNLGKDPKLTIELDNDIEFV